MRRPIILLGLAIFVGALAALVSGAPWLETLLVGDFAIGTLLAAVGLCAGAEAARRMSRAGTWPRRLAVAALVLALAWLPLSMTLAGNARLEFTGDAAVTWTALTLLTLLLVLAALAAALGQGVWRWARRHGESARRGNGCASEEQPASAADRRQHALLLQPAPAMPLSLDRPPIRFAAPSEASASGQVMPTLYNPFPKPPEERIGVALLGLGAYALDQIAPNLANTQHTRLAGLVSGNAEKARTVARAYGLGEEHVYSYDTFDGIADDDAVDVVYVLLPNGLHREWAERAFAAGKHVLCEKPLANTVEECEAMIAAAEGADKRLMTAYRAQFDPYNLRAIEAVQSGEIGTPMLVVGNHGRAVDLDDPRDQWRVDPALAGGGSLFDIGIYSINGARYLLGEEPVEVQARYRPGSGNPGIQVEEGIEYTLVFPSGAVAHCSSSYRVAGMNQLQVEGTEGHLYMRPATSYYRRNLWLENADGRQDIVFPHTNQFAAMLDEMAAAVQEGRAPKTPGEEGLRDVRIMQALYEAAETGRTVQL